MGLHATCAHTHRTRPGLGSGRAHSRPVDTNAVPICGVLDLSHFGSYFLLFQPRSIDSRSSTSDCMDSGSSTWSGLRDAVPRSNNLDSGMMWYSNVGYRTTRLRSVNTEQHELGICFGEATGKETL